MPEEKEKNKTSESEEKTRCPFNPTLQCSNCKLFIPVYYEGAEKGQRSCAFMPAAGR